MKHKKIIIISLVVLAVAVVAYLLFFRKREQPVAFETEKPVKGHIAETVTATGTIQPVDTVAVGTQVSGTISKIYADYNSTVKKGQLLAELDPVLMQANVDQIKANLAQAKSNFAYQEANYARQKQLYDVGAISKAAYDNALNTYVTAKANISSIQAQLTSAEKNLSLTKIYSPIDGVVLSRSVSVGQTVAASFNTPTLFSLAKDITNMQVLAKVDEADIGNIKAGERVTFTVDAYLNDLFKGTVSEIRLRPSTSANVVTYTTIINTRNDSLKLKPGMTATITIYTREASDALLISVKALKYTPDSAALQKQYVLQMDNRQVTAKDDEGVAYVWVKERNKLIRKKIVTGLNDNMHVQVLDGLTENDRVITSMLGGSEAVQAAQGSSSPFMPKFRSRKKK
ncbi:efflux RND transporter periplasmic adaptor subunit [Pedobacter sp. BS3]|uniref:efflux RND transporter periplasmic adaptor subunit n=1 Tax=Pedobacter sp. BS3 TaxID=2567937 RepID=UPI0011ED1BB6|nr:efflux RND transporter periplasmic adaptor subunit [Pedobacter sp. BS3]TZF84710.1 efflux RND transporter periplasmic adaptor subunit [Pedobacter sp. BS3]